MANVYFNYLMFEIDMLSAQLWTVWWQNVEYLRLWISQFLCYKGGIIFLLDWYILPHRVPDHTCPAPCWHHLSCPHRFRCHWAGKSHQLHHQQRQFSHHLIHCQWRHSLLGKSWDWSGLRTRPNPPGHVHPEVDHSLLCHWAEVC